MIGAPPSGATPSKGAINVDRISAMTTFVKVVEAGSLSAAARDLKLSRASVSRLIDGLEDRLRIRLLVRTTRHLAPTEDGRGYYDQAKRILAAIEEAEAALSARHATPSGRLTVAAPVQFGRLIWRRCCQSFWCDFPRFRSICC
jgi:DNA-binding transcriptional LysR family regulator